MRIALGSSIGFIAAALLVLAAPATAQRGRYVDPPSRVARLAHTEGAVSFSAAGASDWRRAQRNRPHWRGDRLWTERRSRAELQLGGAAIRLDERTGIEILELDDRYAQFELSEGTLNLSIRHLDRGDTYEIATPLFALVVDRRANVRIDVDPRSGATEVIVWDGTATAFAERGRFALHEGDAVRFFDATLRDYDFFDPRPDGFDAYADARDARLERSGSLRYVPAGLIGYSDLDEYGAWRATPDYGSVWFPTRVGGNWQPYQDGHWIHQEPWGWTWIDDAEWGFATSHYGRWVQVDRRWGWIPSPRRERPVYAPALVGFVGSFGAGSRQPIGWFPLGPREVYQPSYRTSQDYFSRVNFGNTSFQDRSWVDRAYRDYDSGRGYATDYRYRTQNDIVAVPRDVFMGGRAVSRAAVAYQGDTSARAQLDRIRDLAPVAQSRYGAGATVTTAPQGEVFQREVFARHAPSAGAPAPGAGPVGRERGGGRGRENVRMIRGDGLPMIARDAPRDADGGRERTRDIEPDAADPRAGRELDAAPRRDDSQRELEQQQRAAAQAQREQAREAERVLREQDAAGQGSRRSDDGRRGRDSGLRGDGRDDAERAQREAERAQRQVERAQRDDGRAQDEMRELDRQSREQDQAQREAQRAQREQEQQMRGEQERLGREQQRAQQEAERQGREQQQAQRQAEQQAQQQAQQEAQQEAERQGREQAQREAERQAQQAQQEAERQGREQQQAQRQAEQQAQQEAERIAREQQRAQEQAQREAEQQSRQQQQAEQQAQRDAEQQMRQQQQAQEQAQREAERQAREQQQAQEQAQREAERQAAEQQPAEGEDAERGERRRNKKDIDPEGGGRP